MFNTFVAIGIILLQISLAVMIISWIAKKDLMNLISRHANLILRFVFTGAIVGSLVYQYVLGYPPCILCWYQRIAIFAVGIVLFTSDIRNDKTLQRQVLIFSITGALVAIFHNIIDIFPTRVDVCGTGPSCLARYVYEFGYITIPMMSLTVLLFGVLIPIIVRRFPQTDIAGPGN
jgi:disulfide bond formation protein DsbB